MKFGLASGDGAEIADSVDGDLGNTYSMFELGRQSLMKEFVEVSMLSKIADLASSASLEV